VLFVVPGSPLFEDDHHVFHVFANTSPRDTPLKGQQYLYLGDYNKVPITNTTVELEEWLNLPIRVSAVSLSLSRTTR
jgi:hypothetical protein